MSAILPSVKIDSDAMLARCFMPHQIHWIQAEEEIHALGKQAFALAEKSIRIGWTYADAFLDFERLFFT
jgi:phage FluMu gp28-like protein